MTVLNHNSNIERIQDIHIRYVYMQLQTASLKLQHLSLENQDFSYSHYNILEILRSQKPY